jgi:LacI family transcriptional regulator
LQHVADDAGISRSTVSLVLRNSPLVADKTRQRVLASIQRLGYIYNRGAASLRTQRSDTVGLIITDLANPFFAELASGVEAQLDQENYVAMLGSTTDTIGKQDRFLATLQEHGVDGILLCPARRTPPEPVARVAQMIPIVLIVRDLVGLEVDYVGADYRTGAEMGVAHLLAHGHERIAFIGGPPESSARRDRQQGYEAALRQAGIAMDERLLIHTPVTRNAGRQAIVDLLALAQPPTAALCYNDVVAFGVMLGLQGAGLVPGKDFGVIGADDIAEAALWQPALTTVAIHPRRLGELAARRLLQRIHGPTAPISREVLPAELVIRESCGCGN